MSEAPFSHVDRHAAPLECGRSRRRATTDQELVDLIRNGIPGTAMPPSKVPAAQAALIVAYLRSWPGRSTAAAPALLAGNAEDGRATYAGKGQCADCHIANGTGGCLGPDLSSVGLTRSPADLATALVDPDVVAYLLTLRRPLPAGRRGRSIPD